VICDQYQHANSVGTYNGVFSHATYNFCKFNCATDHFWDGSECSRQFVYSTAQHTSILLSDGCSANTVDDQIEYVKLDSDSGGALTATVGYKPLHSGSWTMSNGVAIQCWHYAAGSWDTSPIFSKQDAGIGHGHGAGNGPSQTHSFTFTPRAGAGDHFVRCGIVDRYSTNDETAEFNAGTHCATPNSGSYGSSHHFDNADVSFTM